MEVAFTRGAYRFSPHSGRVCLRTVAKVADHAISLSRLIDFQGISRPGGLGHLCRERARDRMEAVVRRRVVYRHLPSLRAYILDVAETLRHERVEREAAVQQRCGLSLPVSRGRFVLRGKLTYWPKNSSSGNMAAELPTTAASSPAHCM